MLFPLSELMKRFRFKPSGALHIGANSGEEAEAYDQAGMKRVIWIEANPEIYAKLCNNICKYTDHVALEYCVGEKDGDKVKFNISNNGSQSSSILELGTHLQQHPEVHYIDAIEMETKRVDSMQLDLTGIDFLNIDLQGAELMALRGMGDLLNKFKWAYIEVNKAEVYKGCPDISLIDRYLHNFGFKRLATKWVGDWGDAFYSKR